MATTRRFVPALRFDWLTPLFDPTVRLTTREGKFKSRLLDQAALQPGDRVLDLGCGTGTLAIAAKDRVRDAEVVGLDADPKILARAHHKAADRGVAIQFDEGFSDQLPYPDSSFDAVLSTLFFHHIDRQAKEGTVAEIMRVLRPGGRLHIADFGPPGGPLMWLMSRIVRFGDGRANTHENLTGKLPQVLSAADLADVENHGAMRTLFGSLCFYSARRPANGR